MTLEISRKDRRKPQSQPLRALGVLVLAAVAGCSSLPPEQPPISEADLAWVLAGADRVPPEDGPAETLDELLHVNEPMRTFATEATRGRIGTKSRLSALSQALGAESGLNLQYDSGATLTAEQVFAQKRANCLSYTLLFVALAREVGIPATFNEVDVPPIWDTGDDRTFLLYKHLNARVDLFVPFFEIVDINGDEYDPGFDQRVIPDNAVLAQFDNNRAVELLLQQREAEALRHELWALARAPEAAYLWTNLASLYLRNGSPRAARIAISRALALDPGDLLGYDTAAQIYERLGEHRLAARFQARAKDFLDRSPYYHYQLGIAALRKGSEALARDEAQRAITLYPKDHRFFFLLAVALGRLGESQAASESMQSAIELMQDPAQQQRYRDKFAQLARRG